MGSGLPGSPVSSGVSTPKKQDFICFGFIIQNAVVYISDVSTIPEDVMKYLKGYLWPSLAASTASGPPVLILDCLGLKPHLSHLSLTQSIEYAREIDAQKTYLVGFSHRVAHEEYDIFLKAASRGDLVLPQGRKWSTKEEDGFPVLDLTCKRIWIRPGYDGLQVFVTDQGEAQDPRDDDP